MHDLTCHVVKVTGMGEVDFLTFDRSYSSDNVMYNNYVFNVYHDKTLDNISKTI